MKSVILTVVTLCLCRARVPPSYILQVNPTCGADSIEDAIVNVVTDLDASVKAICENNTSVDFEDVDGVNFRLPVSYPGQGSQPCVFHKREGTLVYVVKVQVAHGQTDSFLQETSEEFTVACVFDPSVSNISRNNVVQEGLIAPVVFQSSKGQLSNSTFTLQLIDVIGNTLSGRDVWRSRKVQLKAESNGFGGEVGLRPVGCDAVSRSGARYAVIRAGVALATHVQLQIQVKRAFAGLLSHGLLGVTCGDGIVFKKDTGFTTKGLVSYSPYFEAFGIGEDIDISFECNFTACVEDCTGNSCTLSEEKRSTNTDPEKVNNAGQILLMSEPIYIKDRSDKHKSKIAPDPSGQPETATALYWTAILGLGLIVLTSLAVSLTACSGVKHVRIWNKA